MRYLFLLAGVLVLGFAWNVSAQMLISNPIIHFDPDSPSSQDVEVMNTGEDTLYAQISVFSVPNPDNGSERVELTDPRRAGLLVSPNRLVVPAGQKKLLRLMVRSPATDKDLVYRVRVEPKTGDIEVITPQEPTKQSGVKILVGYELLVIVRPPDAKPDIHIERNGKLLKFNNQGNTNILIRKLLQCNADKSDCAELPGVRLYAGSHWEVELPRDGSVEVYQSYGLQNSVQQF